MKVLSLETSTSSAKAMIYDSQLGVVKINSCQYGLDIDKNGRMDVVKVFDLACRLAREVTKGETDIVAVGLCETWHNMCAFDKNIDPVSDLFSWNYSGLSGIWDRVRKDKDLTDTFYTRTGCMPHSTYSRTAIKFLKDNGLELSGKTFATQGGYNFYRLTGSLFESYCSMSGSGLINLQKPDYDDFVLDYLGVSKNQFGRLVSYKDTMPLSEDGARMLGLKSGIPVVPAHGDGAMNVTAMNGNRSGVGTLSVGTSGAIRMYSDKPVLPDDHSLWCYRGANAFIVGGATNGACNCVNWFVKHVCEDRYTFKELEENFDPNGEFPTFLPFIFGERCPGWNDGRRDGFYGEYKHYSVNKQFQAVEMGVLFNLYQNYETLCKTIGNVKEIVLAGGIINSRHWIQMVSDIFQQDMKISVCPDASTIGAAALALEVAGEKIDVNSFDLETRDLKTYKFNPDNHRAYRRLYENYIAAYNKV